MPVSSSFKNFDDNNDDDGGGSGDFSLTEYLRDTTNTSLVEMNKMHQDFFSSLLLAAGYFSILLSFKYRGRFTS